MCGRLFLHSPAAHNRNISDSCATGYAAFCPAEVIRKRDEMPKKKKETICVIIGDISYDYTNELMHGMNEAAAQQKVELFYMTGRQKHIASLDLDKELETVAY